MAWLACKHIALPLGGLSSDTAKKQYDRYVDRLFWNFAERLTM